MFLDRCRLLREALDQPAITTDVIVGFPGETDSDFRATMDLLDNVRYQGAYSFKYSDRPQAKSVAFNDKVPEQVKSERLRILQERQKSISLQENKKYEGTMQDIMIEGKSKSGDGQWSGRTMSNVIVNFDGAALEPGQVIRVKITEGLLNSLRGVIV